MAAAGPAKGCEPAHAGRTAVRLVGCLLAAPSACTQSQRVEILNWLRPPKKIKAMEKGRTSSHVQSSSPSVLCRILLPLLMNTIPSVFNVDSPVVD